MKATELRIGNLYNNGGLIRPVEPYDLNHWNSIAKEPIPLTEEWLFRFGFKVDFLFANKGWFGLEYLTSSETWVFEIGSRFVKIKYVHQLQNLYFALTGEELEIKNP